ncbi:hypothetical protein [Nostoc sp. FACHB-110]|uniref:hypothetical protein n=1 Tax=Nostoc sp. FACHB-110 TaxID=2692834 RepID=UPI001685F84F|nr:hypothetical protein [Nostoc sp. FACHB-110]MBD2435369.1 hypothetical protein [Nostoc sp. FACHB-110]
MDNLFKTSNVRFHSTTKRLGFFFLGTFFTVVYAQLCHAQNSTVSSTATTNSPYSWETIFTAVFGAIITVFYLRGMYLVLTYASKTYGLDDEDIDEDDETESRKNKILAFGAFLLVVISALIIASYGFGWRFLYLGPIICLLGPIVPIVAMEFDLKRYQKVLESQTTQRQFQSKQVRF